MRAGRLSVMIVTCAALSGCVAGSATRATKPSPDAAVALEAPSLVGEWNGVFHVYPDIYRLSVTIEPGQGDALTGTARVEQLDGGARRGERKGQPTPVAVRYDESTRTVRLSPASGRSGRGDAIPVLGGVVASDSMGGCVASPRSDSSPYWVLGRGAEGERIISASESVIGGSASRALALVTQPSSDRVVRWAKKLGEEYPQVDPYRTEHGRLFAVARNLFADDHMRAHFGETFDGMGNSGRAGVAATFRRKSDTLRDYSAFERPFQTSGTYCDDDIMVSVLGQRVVRAWRDWLVDSIKRMPARSDSLDRLDALVAAGSSNLTMLWPSERQGLPELAGARVQEIALPVAQLRAQEAIGRAQGLPGARALLQFQDTSSRVLAHVSESDRSRLLAQVGQRADELVAEAVDQRIALVRSMPVGAVRPGVAWYREFNRELGFARARPGVARALAELQNRRGSDLASREQELAQQIASASGRGELRDLAMSTLAVPGDERTPAGARLVRAWHQRVYEIDREEAAQIAIVQILAAYGVQMAGDAVLKDAKDFGDWVLAGGAILVRDSLINDAVDRVLPGEPQSVRSATAYVIKQLMDGKVSPEAVTVDLIEAQILKNTKDPNVKRATEATAFVVQLGLRKRDLEKARQ